MSVDSLLRSLGRILSDALVDSLLASLGSTGAKTRREKRRSRSTGPSPSRPAGSAQRARPSAPSGRSIREAPLAEALTHAYYSPDPDGAADPGEIVWTWVPYQEDASQGKDRPVLVIGREGEGLYVVQLTSKDHDRDAEQEARWGRYWLDIGAGPWDPKGRPSEVRLDRALWVRASEIRREGSSVPKATWSRVVEALKEHA